MSRLPQGLGSSVCHVTVDREFAGQRIDNFLLRLLKGIPRSHVYRLLRKGEVRVNKGRIKAEYRLEQDDLVRIPPVRIGQGKEGPAPARGLMDRLQKAILYEDEGLLVINKPSGIAVHGGSGLSHGVIEAMREMRPRDKGLELIHRLDRDTSGCLMLARKRSTLRLFHALLRENRISKRYLALVAGQPQRDHFKVEQPLRKNTLRSGERVVRVDPDGKSALTFFHVLERLGRGCLLEADLRTGRTHQIRVHLQSSGLPIVGDTKYGEPQGTELARQLGCRRLGLHAAKLEIRLPERSRPLVIEAPLDESLQHSIERLRIG